MEDGPDRKPSAGPDTGKKDTPNTDATPAQPAAPPETPAGTKEIDEWGLPLRKPARPAAQTSAEVAAPTVAPDPETEEAKQKPDVGDNAVSKHPDKGDGVTELKDPPTPEKRNPNRDSKHSASGSQSHPAGASAWSHQHMAPTAEIEDKEEEKDEWQTMPAFAPFDMYNDDGKLIAKEAADSDEELDNTGLGGAGKGYTRVQLDEDAQSATSMDDNTAYLFKETSANLLVEDEEARDMLGQMQTTKSILTEGQRIAYVGIVRLAMISMIKTLSKREHTRGTKKLLEAVQESMKLWSQTMMLRLYSHMEIESAEQVMIEQLAEHGVEPSDLTPSLMQNARVANPMRQDQPTSTSVNADSHKDSEAHLSPAAAQRSSPSVDGQSDGKRPSSVSSTDKSEAEKSDAENEDDFEDAVEDIVPESKPDLTQKSLDIDLRWTVLCDLFLLLIDESAYDARSRRLLETVAGYLDVSWLDICRFEKRVTDAIEMQENANKENWNEGDHMESRRKAMRNRRLAVMGLATVGGGLVIGLSMGLLAPLIGAGLAAGFTTFGVAGTSSFLAGAGGAAIITTTGVVTGSRVGFKASNRRTGHVKTFEYRPLHNNKRVNLIVTVAGWLTGKVDDVRLPFSTVDPIMGDMYSVFWEPEMLQSMGQTINILATEALTQALQQVLGSTILTALMAAIQIPIVLSKLAYLIDNPWTVSLARADLAGLILADSLVDRNLGARPITLVGFSLGARVIYAALRELAKKGECGIVQNVYIFGAPMVYKKDEWIKIRSIVSGRVVNGYANNDWILGYLFRATSGGVMRVVGLAPLELTDVENYDVTEWVPGHMSYRQAMPRLLREVGWLVESDEFTEIEDPDPEDHGARQRELIDEIEEARKELEEKPTSRFGFFATKRKKLAEKKAWETYDEKVRNGGSDDKDALETRAGGVLFDVDALRAEVAELAAHGIQVRELPESTLPPMRLDIRPAEPVDAASPVIEASAPATPLPRGAAPEEKPPSGGEAKAAATAAAAMVGVAASRAATLPEQRPAADGAAGPSSSPPPRPALRSIATAPAVPMVSLEHNAWVDEFEDGFGQEKDMALTFE